MASYLSERDEVIVLKNDRQVFTNPNHPKNDSSYRVKLSV